MQSPEISRRQPADRNEITHASVPAYACNGMPAAFYHAAAQENPKNIAIKKIIPTFADACSAGNAQMAESVDALVSNTSRFTPVPVRPRLWVQ